jgi:hypothetical protein
MNTLIRPVFRNVTVLRGQVLRTTLWSERFLSGSSSSRFQVMEQPGTKISETKLPEWRIQSPEEVAEGWKQHHEKKARMEKEEREKREKENWTNTFQQVCVMINCCSMLVIFGCSARRHHY